MICRHCTNSCIGKLQKLHYKCATNLFGISKIQNAVYDERGARTDGRCGTNRSVRTSLVLGMETQTTHLKFRLLGLGTNTRDGLIENLKHVVRFRREPISVNRYFSGQEIGGLTNTRQEVRVKLGDDVHDGHEYPCVAEVEYDRQALAVLMPVELRVRLGFDDAGVLLPDRTHFLQGHHEMFHHLLYKGQTGCSLYRNHFLKTMVSKTTLPHTDKPMDKYKMMFVPFILDPHKDDIDRCVWMIDETYPDVYVGQDNTRWCSQGKREKTKYRCICSHDNKSPDGLKELHPRLYVPMEMPMMREVARLRHALASKSFSAVREAIEQGGTALLEHDALVDFCGEEQQLRDCRKNSGGTIAHCFIALRFLEKGLWGYIWNNVEERLIVCFGSVCKHAVTFENCTGSHAEETGEVPSSDDADNRPATRQRTRGSWYQGDETLLDVVRRVRGGSS